MGCFGGNRHTSAARISFVLLLALFALGSCGSGSSDALAGETAERTTTSSEEPEVERESRSDRSDDDDSWLGLSTDFETDGTQTTLPPETAPPPRYGRTRLVRGDESRALAFTPRR